MKINTNISALMATGNLHRTEDKITTSLTRLSSGYRINKAADDAAGMAISQKMHADFSARPVMVPTEFHLFRRQREH